VLARESRIGANSPVHHASRTIWVRWRRSSRASLGVACGYRARDRAHGRGQHPHRPHIRLQWFPHPAQPTLNRSASSLPDSIRVRKYRCGMASVIPVQDSDALS
jgi:hypothetical protein